MNEYKITYTTGRRGDDTLIARRIDRTELTARQSFINDCKKHGVIAEVVGIELIRDDACATKQQERDTLAAIRRMVEELGPQSHLTITFDGCWEDAERNIENDFGDSMKDRWLHAGAQLNAANGTIEELREQLKAQTATAELNERDLRAALTKVKAEFSQITTALRERVLAPDDLTDAIQLVTEKRLALDTEVKNAAERIVEAASEPESAAFQNAVKDHRAAKSDLDYYTALLERMVKARGE